jgi:hypothetical protein
MFRMSANILAVQFSVIVDLDGDHPRTVDEPFLLVHHHLDRLFPSANNPLSVLIVTHRHGVLLFAVFSHPRSVRIDDGRFFR